VKLIRPLNQIRSILSGHGQAPARALRPKNVVVGFVAGWALLVAVPHPVSAFPKAQGYVNDFAGILNSRVSAVLESELRAAERQTSAEIVLVTVPSLEGMTIEAYANGLFNEWRIGKRGKDNGVLVLAAPAERHVRIEVGYGLEPVLPDGLAGEIIRTDFLPAFRRGDFANGILAGVRHITEVVTRDHTLTADERRQLTVSQTVQPPWLFIVSVFGVFIVIGAFVFGLGLGVRSIFLLLWGIGFSVFDVLILILIPMPASALWCLRALGLGMVVCGLIIGRKTARQASSGFGRGSTSGWRTDMSSASSDSGSSSGGDFGGGSSGGGGASGSW
jgi:uncharacterized protein